MPMKLKKVPLGTMQLETGCKEIFPMLDIFINYCLGNKKNWENLRSIINIFTEYYWYLASENGKNANNAEEQVKLITGNIKVKSQYEYFTKNRQKQKAQDFQITLLDDPVIIFKGTEKEKKVFDQHYVESQNSAETKPPIFIRGVDYLALSVSRNNNSYSNVFQTWLLADINDETAQLLDGMPIAVYAMSELITHKAYPNNYNLMYICLPCLVDVKGRVGELAKFLMGFEVDITDETVDKIADCFRKSFEIFKDDKEAVKTMSIDEKRLYEGDERRARATALEMLADGFAFDKIAKYVDRAVSWVEDLANKTAEA